MKAFYIYFTPLIKHVYAVVKMNITLNLCILDRKYNPNINLAWLELPISQTNLHGPFESKQTKFNCM